MYKIRAGKTEDYPILLEYGLNFCHESHWIDGIGYDAESVRPWLDLCKDAGILFVVESDGEVVGMAGGFVTPYFFNKNVLQGTELFWWIKPEHRNGGVGKALLATLENAARKAGAARWNMVAVEALDPDKVGAIYERAGYTRSEISYMKVL